MTARINFVLMLLLCSEMLLTGCKQKARLKNDPNNEYTERVSNLCQATSLRKYLDDGKCITIYLLQTTKCNVCSKGSLDSIGRIENNKNRKVVFFVSGHQETIDNLLENQFHHNNIDIVYDDSKEMPGLGLSFFRDISVDVCDKKVINWQFID